MIGEETAAHLGASLRRLKAADRALSDAFPVPSASYPALAEEYLTARDAHQQTILDSERER